VWRRTRHRYRRASGSRSRSRGGRWCRCCCGRWCRRWSSSLDAESGHVHCIGRTTAAGSHFAYHHHKGLTVVDVERERCTISRNRTTALVRYPIRADVIWIEGPQVSCREDEVAALAVGIDIHRYALSGPGGVGEGVCVVMVRLPIAKDLARIRGATAARNNSAIQSINLRTIAVINASSDCDRRAGRRGRGRRCPRGPRATAIDVKDVVHVGETNASGRDRVRIVAVWRTKIARPGFRRSIRVVHLHVS
jgi:hypothetical protein